MSLRKKAAVSLGWTFAQQFGNRVVGFIISLVLARILLPEEFGLIGMIAVVVAIGNGLLEGGLTKSLIREQNSNNLDYSTVFFYQLITSVLIYLLVFWSAPLIASFYNEKILVDIIRIYCISFIIYAFSSVQRARLIKAMNFKTETIISFPATFFGGITGVVLALNGFGVWSLVWSTLSGAVLSSILLWYFSDWYPTFRFDTNSFKKHFNYGYKLSIADILNRIFNNIYLIVIGKYFSAAQVGFYTRAETMKQFPVSNINAALDKVTFPLLVGIQDDNLRLKKVFRKLMLAVTYVITPVLVLLAVIAEPVFRFLFTEKWLPAVPYFQILCVTGILYPLHSYNLTILNVKGRSDLFLKLEIFKKIIIVLTIVIALPFGIMALLYAQVVASIFALAINSFYTGKFIQYSGWQQMLDLLPVFILNVLCGVLVYFLDYEWFSEFTDIIRILTGSFMMLFIYWISSHLLKFESLLDLKKLLSKRKQKI